METTKTLKLTEHEINIVVIALYQYGISLSERNMPVSAKINRTLGDKINSTL